MLRVRGSQTTLESPEEWEVGYGRAPAWSGQEFYVWATRAPYGVVLQRVEGYPCILQAYCNSVPISPGTPMYAYDANGIAAVGREIARMLYTYASDPLV